MNNTLEELRRSYENNENVIKGIRRKSRRSKKDEQEIRDRRDANARLEERMRAIEDAEYRQRQVDFAENAPTEIERRVMLHKLAGSSFDDVYQEILDALLPMMPEADETTIGDAASTLWQSTLRGLDAAIQDARTRAGYRAARAAALQELARIPAPPAFVRTGFESRIETSFPPYDKILQDARDEAAKATDAERKAVEARAKHEQYVARQRVIDAEIAAGRLPADATPEELRTIAEWVATADQRWHADPDPVKPRTPKQMQDDYGSPRFANVWAYILRDRGMYCDSRLILRMTPRWELPTDEPPRWFDRMAKICEEYLAERTRPAKLVGGWAVTTDGNYPAVVYETDLGDRQAFQAQLVADIKREHPGCTWGLSGGTLPMLVAYVDGNAVGCVASLKEDIPNTFPKRPRLGDLFEPGPYTVDDMTSLGKIRGTNGYWDATPATVGYVHGDGGFHPKGSPGVDDPAARQRREFYESLTVGDLAFFRVEKQDGEYAIVHTATECVLAFWTRKRDAEQFARLVERLPIPWGEVCEDRPLTTEERQLWHRAKEAFINGEMIQC